jgi:hypothetical protein
MSVSQFQNLVLSIVKKEKSKLTESEVKYKIEMGGKGYILSEEKL